MILRHSGWYSPELCRKFPGVMFVFGDNTLGFGKGGQAIIRSEKNAFGVPTKREPTMGKNAFFEEGNMEDMAAVLQQIKALWDLLEQGKVVVIPETTDGYISLGRERAELPERAPSIYAAICTHVEEMQNAYGYAKTTTEEEIAHHIS